jgi:hypothetical protein
MADEVRKMVIYELAAADYQFVGVAGNEFVLEVPEDRADLADSVRGATIVTAEKILGPMAKDCCVVRAAYTW